MKRCSLAVAALLLLPVVIWFVVFSKGGEERDHSLQKMGHAAVVILHNKEMTRFLMQRKTEGYPYWEMVNTVCFFGGNKESEDAYARQTLSRELSEEALLEPAGLSLQPFARYLISAPIEMMKPKDWTYEFECAVFSAEVGEETNQFLVMKEGNLEWLSLVKLANTERFAWGYDTILRDFVLSKLQINIQFRADYNKCKATRYDRLAILDNWSSNEQWE